MVLYNHRKGKEKKGKVKTMTIKETKYGVRNIKTNEITIYTNTEHEAIEMAAAINKEMNEEVLEIVKIVTTMTIETM
jgi:hypothetical protein